MSSTPTTDRSRRPTVEIEIVPMLAMAVKEVVSGFAYTRTEDWYTECATTISELPAITDEVTT